MKRTHAHLPMGPITTICPYMILPAAYCLERLSRRVLQQSSVYTKPLRAGGAPKCKKPVMHHSFLLQDLEPQGFGVSALRTRTNPWCGLLTSLTPQKCTYIHLCTLLKGSAQEGKQSLGAKQHTEAPHRRRPRRDRATAYCRLHATKVGWDRRRSGQAPY